MPILNKTYTREEIHEMLGGDMQSYLPHKDGKVVCGCFRLDTNPDAPNVRAYFIASQFHPEFKSRPTRAHPLFRGLIEAALKRQNPNNSQNGSGPQTMDELRRSIA